MESTAEKKQLCIVCDGDGDGEGEEGELLGCSDDECPIYIHRGCIGCKPYVDPMGNYYCSYCAYRRLMREAALLEEKAMVAKKQLSLFLERETSKIEQDDKRETTRSKKDKTCLADENDRDDNSMCEETDKQADRRRSSGDNDNTCRIMVVYTPNLNLDGAYGVDSVLDKGGKIKRKAGLVESDDAKRPKVVNQIENENPKCGESVDGACDVDSVLDKGDKMKRKAVLVESNDTKTTKVVNQTENDNPKSVDDHRDTDTGNTFIKQEVPQKKDSSDRGTHAPIPFRKPGRVLWSNEEVDKLKEGVEKYTETVRKNVPWKKILEFGRDTFNPSRTPSDLKDKYRNITK